MEYIAIILGMIVVVLLFAYLVNGDYWQAYNNSKFIDEFLNDEQDPDVKDLDNIKP